MKVFEVESFFQRAIDQSPAQRLLAIELAELRDDFGRAQGAPTLVDLVHPATPMRARRSLAGGCE